MTGVRKLLGLKLDALGRRLESALATAGIKKVEFAQLMGVDPSSVTKWIRGNNLPSSNALAWLSEKTGEPVGKLLGLREPPDDAIAEGDQVSLPRLLRVAAGNPVFHRPDKGEESHVQIDRKAVERLVGPIPEKKPENVVFAADVDGESMAPGIQPGDVLIVQRYYPPTRGAIKDGARIIESGGLYLVTPETDGDAQVKRLVLTGGHELLVLSDNPRFKPKTIDLREVGMIQHVVIGRPVKLIRDL